ncbi:MAG: SPOR domain-containing protein [Cyanobacteria bacterium]|nr:SPOR domain-containing protein [Cyanobacteria bacterium CG_2015-16_32_12]NCO78720.1 SPOR domain-containing protein [Cyanobacteria bacterium CG_2015-22_32_23]NCQ03213.1 SPOR domain-containing protein [Cyanobacteria bacterium CG_2015-09_32_10]NCQ40562.1 SPOR domain-containing protein [Cyanobacteria bacterium CG_2015-04_32_10]NCS85360.1 SPOR domain-containing protein [Cyanobacteria bacterium CG_2015-02_32_10]
MSEIVTSVHPQIKKIIQNLDLDLGLELNRYEKSHKEESVLIPDLIIEQPITTPKYQEYNSALVYNPDIFQPEETISVASRLIGDDTISDSKSLLDVILTPWGIFAIILFFGANLFIFFSQDKEILVNNPTENQPLINTPENQNQETNLTENNPNIENQNININTIQKPSLPNPLSENQNNSIVANKSPVYPDLKTALFAEIKKNQSPLSLSIPTNNSPENLLIPKVNQKYYLLSNYQNMDNFNLIKKVIPNAQIVKINQQAKIQLGIFNSEIEAKNQGQKLQSKGIKIYIQPTNN